MFDLNATPTALTGHTERGLRASPQRAYRQDPNVLLYANLTSPNDAVGPRGDNGPRRTHVGVVQQEQQTNSLLSFGSTSSSSYLGGQPQTLYLQQQQHSGVLHASRSSEEGPSVVVPRPTAMMEAPRTRHNDADEELDAVLQSLTVDPTERASRVLVTAPLPSRSDPTSVPSIEASAAAVSHLKIENRNLRMRLLYLDELMAKRNLHVDLVNDLADAKLELEMLRRELTEAKRHVEQQNRKTVETVSLYEALRVKEVAWEAERVALLQIPKLEAEVKRLNQDFKKRETQWLEERHTLQSELDTIHQKYRDLQDEMTDLREAHRLHGVRNQEEREQEVQRLLDTVRQSNESHQTAQSEWQAAMHDVTRKVTSLEADLAQRNETVRQQEIDLVKLRGELRDRDADVARLRSESDATASAHRREEVAAQHNYMAKCNTLSAVELKVVELERAVTTSEELQQVYKRSLQYLLDSIRTIEGLPAVDAPTTMMLSAAVMGGVAPVLLSHHHQPQGASSPPRGLYGDSEPDSGRSWQPRGHRDEGNINNNSVSTPSYLLFSPTRGESQLTSAAATMIASVLTSTVDDAIRQVRQERARIVSLHEDVLRRQVQSIVQGVEQWHIAAEAKLRRFDGRLADASDAVELLARRRKRNYQEQRANYLYVKEEALKSSTELATAHRRIQSLVIENQQLREETHRLSTNAEMNAAATGFSQALHEAASSVQGSVRLAVQDMKAHVLDTNVITEAFLDSIKQLCRKAHATVEEMHQRIDVAHRQYHTSSSHPASPTSLSSPSRSHSFTQQSGSNKAFTVEHLINQFANVATLLETNRQQSSESTKRLKEVLKDWEAHVVGQLSTVESKIKDTIAPLKFARGVQNGQREVAEQRSASPVPPLASAGPTIVHLYQPPRSSVAPLSRWEPSPQPQSGGGNASYLQGGAGGGGGGPHPQPQYRSTSSSSSPGGYGATMRPVYEAMTPLERQSLMSGMGPPAPTAQQYSGFYNAV